jgi:isocitrate/isopropylmalate dehydrogenase
VHGSADDIAGKGRVNPFATMRAAAAMLERHAACAGAERLMETAVHRLTEAGVTTADLGGRSSTGEVVAAALEILSREAARHARHNDGSGSDSKRDRPASGKQHVLVPS